MVIASASHDVAYVRAWALTGFDELVISKGGDPVEMLEDAGIDPGVLERPDTLVPFACKEALLEIASQRLGAPSLGLEWALSSPAHFPDTGPTLLLAEAAGTFGAWLERSARYWRLQTNAFTPEVVYRDELDAFGVRISRHGTQSVSRQQAEHIAGKITRLTRAMLDDETDPLRVSFMHARPEDTTLHDLVFRCPLEFGASHDEILFRRDLLARGVGRRQGEVQAIADEFLRYRISLLPRYTPGVSTSTALAIKTVLGAGICSKEFIAQVLGCSPRKLQRLLAGEGTTYEAVLDAVRRELACELLADSAAPIAAIGGMLDFASPAAMTLAVRRWTGMTPSGYRANVRTAVEADQTA